MSEFIVDFKVEPSNNQNEECEDVSCILLQDTEEGFSTTLLEDGSVDILHDHDKIGRRILNFLDSKKNKIKLWPVMIDITQKGNLPFYTDKPCRYCHHCFNTHPIGCPVRYNPDIIDKNSDEYKRVIDFLNKYNFNTESTDFFETEHLFCSWPCVKAYILNMLSTNSMSQKYTESLSYLTLMYKKVNDLKGDIYKIPVAPPIDILEAYGGHLTIDEYRSSFGTIDYKSTVNIRRPYMFSCSQYIEEVKVKI